MVSKPFEIFFEKKFNSDEAKMDEARLAWSSLSAKKQIKFIRKTEASYDANQDKNKEPLHTYLSKKELDVLMKAYGMPEKPAQNSRFYYIDKYKDEYVNGTEEKRVQEVRNDAIEKWKTLSKEEKDRITEEFHQLQDRYTDQFFNFARNLPEQRVVDFKYYTSSVKKSDVESNDESNNVESTSNSKPRKPKENLFKVFIPYEVYIEKHQPDEASSFEERSKMRSTYAALPGKKKLKYIKKAEEQYDSFDFSKSQTKPLFTSFLSKNEVQLLFDSYGMPENVPSNLSAYFMKKNFKEGLKNMQLVFNKFRGLTESEKSDLLKEHARELKDYSNKTREFVEKLPANRQDDYKFLKNKNSKSKALDDGYSQQPAKKIKTS